MPRGGRARSWRLVLTGVVVVLAFAFGLPGLTSYSEVWEHARSMGGGSASVLVGLALWNLASYWFVLMAALPGLRLHQAALSNVVSTATANTVPAGGAVGVAVTASMYRSWGFDVDATARAVLLSGIWNNLIKLALPAVSLGLVLSRGRADGRGAVVAGLVILVVLVGLGVWVLRSSRLVGILARRAEAVASKVGALSGRAAFQGWDRAAERVRSDTVAVIRERWVVLSASALVSHLSLFAVLLASLRAMGVPADEVPASEALLSFALVRLALMVPITPGGAGLAELGLSGSLVSAGGHEAGVVAAVLVFRALTWLLPILLGPIALVWWRTGGRARRDPAPAMVPGGDPCPR